MRRRSAGLRYARAEGIPYEPARPIHSPPGGNGVIYVLLALLAGAVVYSLLSVVAALRYLSVRPPRLSSTEPISILKPLAGLDLGLESNLRTFFEQDYPALRNSFRGTKPG